MRATKIDNSLVAKVLNDLNTNEIAVETRFTRSSIQSKMDGLSFVSSFWLMLSEGKNTLGTWCRKFSHVSIFDITQQGIEHKINCGGVAFAKTLFERSMKTEVAKVIAPFGELFSGFAEVYIQDSTCLSIHSQLRDSYKGSHSRKDKPHATVKLQVTLEMINSLISKVGVGDFRKNDQSCALDILDVAQAGSLVLRDLGYFSMASIKAMLGKGIFFVSRLKSNVSVFEKGSTEPSNLAELLAKKAKQGVVDMGVIIGVENPCSVRLIAHRLPEEVANRRKQKAKEDRSTKANHSDAYYELLAWAILITNISEEKLSADEVVKVYKCRWRIEILFKAWKSGALKMHEIFKQKMSLARFEVTLYLTLLYITHFCQACYSALDSLIRAKTNEISRLSLSRTYVWVCENLIRLCKMSSIVEMANEHLREVQKYCTYEKRKDRQNFAEILT
jgi:Transposase DDE domain